MFEHIKNKKLLILLFVAFLVFGSIFIFSSFYRIGPGLPPAEGMPEWYLIDSNTYDSLFPFISINTASESHSDSLVLIVWYFERELLFQEAKKTLHDYLIINGKTENMQLDFTKELDTTVNATKYEGKKTAGYFVVYENPFLETRDDFFIVYHGTTETHNFSDHERDLMKLISQSYYSNSGKVTSLN
ncbi:hypothetical protein [Methanococcoides burtonii]|uniref:Uncharacterized protein n=1 Tax=Methanococcoides burtonii (strain DSM 6242 / NBRC 107633 / OCM 468 / ACE-M) TaxID=259564 RepID=Q12YG5_METBU|nr:hypothetical protein [Methanococcoides burtonii]ABE51511.1 Hypothetical protein Mbur_0533 [Methanococcoides burtonii DSM 6242]